LINISNTKYYYYYSNYLLALQIIPTIINIYEYRYKRTNSSTLQGNIRKAYISINVA
jgi:hypothetical protein